MMRVLLAALALAIAVPATAQTIPSKPGVDAPELAALGPHGVGYRTVTFVHRAQPDLEAVIPVPSDIGRRDRILTVDLWYPATVKPGQRAVTYRASFSGEPPRAAQSFTQKGLAVAGAKPIGSRHPLVIVSHGYGNAPASMTWLTENLASKGYVVAAIRHNDPNAYVVPPHVRAAPNYFRPSDIAFVAAQLRVNLGQDIDPANTALIGYSQGGYGVLAAGGATLDPAHPYMDIVAGGWLKTIARGGAGEAAAKVPGVKAIVALAPAGGGQGTVWGPDGLAQITAPLLLIAGEHDPVVGYELGAKAFFAQARNSDRYLLTYRLAGHAIALNPVPAEMRGTLWDIDWFEDPIWRQDRINAINLHFISAFLALKLRGDAAMQPYMNVPVEESDSGVWNAPAATPWGAYSPGGDGVTLWKGFQRGHARGMVMEHHDAGT